jgi:hypothetical protein
MKKHPKFLIAQNPMVSQEDVYIFHSQKPRFLAKVENNAIEIIDDIDNMIEFYKGNTSKIEGLMNRMADWYKSFQIYRHGQIHGNN